MQYHEIRDTLEKNEMGREGEGMEGDGSRWWERSLWTQHLGRELNQVKVYPCAHFMEEYPAAIRNSSSEAWGRNVLSLEGQHRGQCGQSIICKGHQGQRPG